ncbi:MAG: cell division protein ZipA C-terminal FtsZ-binding domain-containing protein [Lamprobacter sp.]|uniref:cell division protein ZipA C-terminal FtsZ-binding domain-containing protein n=1 Tax=Lamprobacter sp. TaxID=3100796 RepID=UPI002B25B8C5|nr:cell division protein ZipA C-terminal FtsZ-binding domain-containing protein [Lamprobacter sp.]MEA3639758.1 cell division protein ZipA C-terminal FtsZ-binding domain-containing protein [Lamprobacter sp.]
MNETSLAILLASAAAVLGLVALAVFYFSVLKHRDEDVQGEDENEDQEASELSAASQPAKSANSGQARTRAERKKKYADKTQRYLFVVFDEPGPETNRALGQLLKDTNAFYEAALGIYHIPPGPEGYPLTVANASSPGTLPPLHLDADGHPPVDGVSILIKFINSRSLARSPDTMVAFTRRAAGIGGRILDVERNPVTEETLAGLGPDAN